MFEVELVNQANLSVDAYREAYQNRYGDLPLLEDNARMYAFLFLKKVVRQYGPEKTLALLSFYLHSNGNKDWWITNGHSLKCFENDFAALHAAFCINQDKRRAQLGASVEVMDHLIAFMTRCYQCNQDFEIVCRGSEMGDKTHLTLCLNCEPKAA